MCARDVLPRLNAVMKNYYSAPFSQLLWHLSLLPSFCTHFCSMTKSCSSNVSVIQPPLITLAGMGVPYPASPVPYFLTVLSLPLPSCSSCSTCQPVTLLRHKVELLTPLLKNPPWLHIRREDKNQSPYYDQMIRTQHSDSFLSFTFLQPHWPPHCSSLAHARVLYSHSLCLKRSFPRYPRGQLSISVSSSLGSPSQ